MNDIREWQGELDADQVLRETRWLDWYRQQLMSGTIACPPPGVTADMVHKRTGGVATIYRVELAHADLGARPSRVPSGVIVLPKTITEQQMSAFKQAWRAATTEGRRHITLEPIRSTLGSRWDDSGEPGQWWTPLGRIDHRGPLIPLRRHTSSGYLVAPAFVISLLVLLVVLAALALTRGYRRFGGLCVGDWAGQS